MAFSKKIRPTNNEFLHGISDGNTLILSRAITIIESSLPDDRVLATSLLDQVLPLTGKSIRIGVTGIPGVGKSTFIEVLGNQLTQLGKKVAVLSVDPTSSLSRGSILGDKTRMSELAHNPDAYIRPSPARDSLGGVAPKTREAILLCEAAGFDIIIVETVGVGQSETIVRDMTDFFLLLMIPGAGDDLQGMKRGIMEMADTIVINKADGNNLQAAKISQNAYSSALHLFPPKASGWIVPVQTCSAIDGTGVAEAWNTIEQYNGKMTANGFLFENRNQQRIKWLHELIKEKLTSDFFSNSLKQDQIKSLTEQVAQEKISVRKALELAFN
jgi:LAO/AO transport system kinase